jgi:hypothetical protein
MTSNLVTMTLPDTAIPVVKFLRGRKQLSSTVAQFLIDYGKKHGIR